MKKIKPNRLEYLPVGLGLTVSHAYIFEPPGCGKNARLDA
jgi:hypothetical protein